jgi:hypothetical protein
MNYQEPSEVQSIKSLLNIAKILAIIFGIIFLIGGVITAFGSIFFGILLIVWGIVDFLIYFNIRPIETMVGARQYEQAKAKSLLWMILGLVLGGILIGVILLIVYIKFDPLINLQRNMMGQGAAPGGGYPPPPGTPSGWSPPPPTYAPQLPQGTPSGWSPPPPIYAAPPPQATPPPPPVAAPTVPFCPTCGKPGTYIAQYGRYYCYDDKTYL